MLASHPPKSLVATNTDCLTAFFRRVAHSLCTEVHDQHILSSYSYNDVYSAASIYIAFTVTFTVITTSVFAISLIFMLAAFIVTPCTIHTLTHSTTLLEVLHAIAAVSVLPPESVSCSFPEVEPKSASAVLRATVLESWHTVEFPQCAQCGSVYRGLNIPGQYWATTTTTFIYTIFIHFYKMKITLWKLTCM